MFIVHCSRLLILFLLLLSVNVSAIEQQRPKIGIALSGGGARGMAHVGVLEVLEELRVPIDYIAGTSMGSIVGGLYASGVTSEELHHAAVEGINWQAVLNTTADLESLSYREKQNRRRFFLNLEMGLGKDMVTVPSGLLNGQNLFLELKRFTNHIKTTDFSQFPIPFKAVATDLNTAEPYLLEHGDLALVLRASMAVPFVFAPVEIDGRILVDGGILNNLPVEVVRAMGADVVIAINISAPLEEIESGSSFLQVSKQSVEAALIQNTRQALKNADIIITPDIEEFSSTDFFKGSTLIARGREAVEKKDFLFKNLSLNPEAYQQYRSRFNSVSPRPTHITPSFIGFTGNQRTSTSVLQGKVVDLLKQNLSISEIELASKRLMSLNDFEHVTYNIEQNSEGESGLIFNVREKPWGPNYFRFGINAGTTFEGKADVNLLVRHEMLNINRLGSEWVTEVEFGTGFAVFTEYYQPLDYRRRFFIAPYAYLQRRFVDVFREQTAIAEYDVKRFQFGFDIGRNFSNFAVLRVGLRSSSEEARVRIGDPNLPTGNFQEDALTLGFGYDTLDDRVFATRGMRIAISGEVHDKLFNSDTHYQKLELYTRHHSKINQKVTLVSELNLGTFFRSTPPEYESFSISSIGRLGGLGGFTQGNIGGRQALMMSLGGLFNSQSLAKYSRNTGIRLLALLLAGNAWDSYEQVNLKNLNYGGLGAIVWDTQFGTILLGTGYTSEGSLRYSLSLGNFF